MGKLVAAIALAASIVQPGSVAATRTPAGVSPRPQTLYSMPKGTIQAFAQDGPLVAWFAPSKNACNAVYVLSLANGGRVQLPDETTSAPNVTCRWEVVPPVGLAVARTSADVLWTLREASPVPFDYVLGASGADPTERRFKEVAHSPKGPGLWLGGVAGNGDALVYAVTNVAYVDEVACLSGGSCEMKITGGGVYRVMGRKPPPLIDGTTAAAEVAVASETIALVPATTVGKNGIPLPADPSPIEVRDLSTGALISQPMTLGVPLAIALSDNLLVSLERTSIGLRIAWYDPASGTFEGSVPVNAAAAPELSATDQMIVFRVGRSIRAVDPVTRRIRVLTKAATVPIGLSLEGSRVAWAENVKGRGRIRAVYVKGRG